MKTPKTMLLLLCICSFANAQTKGNDKIELQKVLKNSLYESVVNIDKDGAVSRKDNNGNTFRYVLSDIKEVKTAFDGFNNLLIFFKEGKSAATVIKSQQSEQSMNVFSFANAEDCEKAKTLFLKIISEKE